MLFAGNSWQRMACLSTSVKHPGANPSFPHKGTRQWLLFLTAGIAPKRHRVHSSFDPIPSSVSEMRNSGGGWLSDDSVP